MEKFDIDSYRKYRKIHILSGFINRKTITTKEIGEIIAYGERFMKNRTNRVDSFISELYVNDSIESTDEWFVHNIEDGICHFVEFSNGDKSFSLGFDEKGAYLSDISHIKRLASIDSNTDGLADLVPLTVVEEHLNAMKEENITLLQNADSSGLKIDLSDNVPDNRKIETSRANSYKEPLIEKLLLKAWDRMFLQYWDEADRALVLVNISSSLYDLIDIGIRPEKENEIIFQRKLDKEIDKWMEKFIHNGGLGATIEYVEDIVE